MFFNNEIWQNTINKKDMLRVFLGGRQKGKYVQNSTPHQFAKPNKTSCLIYITEGEDTNEKFIERL